MTTIHNCAARCESCFHDTTRALCQPQRFVLVVTPHTQYDILRGQDRAVQSARFLMERGWTCTPDAQSAQARPRRRSYWRSIRRFYQ